MKEEFEYYARPKRSREDCNGILRKQQKLDGYDYTNTRKSTKQKSKRTFETVGDVW